MKSYRASQKHIYLLPTPFDPYHLIVRVASDLSSAGFHLPVKLDNDQNSKECLHREPLQLIRAGSQVVIGHSKMQGSARTALIRSRGVDVEQLHATNQGVARIGFIARKAWDAWTTRLQHLRWRFHWVKCCAVNSVVRVTGVYLISYDLACGSRHKRWYSHRDFSPRSPSLTSNV